MQTLRFKLFFLTILLVGITQLGTLITTAFMAESDATRQAQASLSIGEALFNELMRGRSKALIKSVTTTAAKVPANIDIPSQQTWLAAESTTIGAAFSLLLDNHGGSIAVSDNTLSSSYPDLVSRADEDGFTRSALSFDGRFFEMITVPVPGILPKTWLSSGFEIDAQLFRQLRDRTGLDISIIGRSDDRQRVIASSFAVDTTGTVETALITATKSIAELTAAKIGNERFLIKSRPFLNDTRNIVILLQAPLNQAVAPYRTLQLIALMVGAVSLIIAILGATRISRSINAPAGRMLATVRRIGVGDYDTPVDTRRNEEFTELTSAINTMQTQIARREKQAMHKACFDQLTDLPNRLLALQSLKKSIATMRSMDGEISVLICYLSGFSEIRASFGQATGDELLVSAMARLQATIPEDSSLARLEGDEFLLVMESTGSAAAISVASDITHLLSTGLSNGIVHISAPAFIGISTFPHDGDDAEKLLLDAAIACHEARKKPDHISTYQTGTEEKYGRRLEILGSLHRATQENELRLYMQPKVNLVNGSICGAEALMRWDHPTLGFLSPLEFIAIAEQSGNISVISEWAIRTAIHECRLWIEEGLDLPVSVNLSGHDLLNENLPQMIVKILKEHDLDPAYLILEITEQALFHNFELATGVLQTLHDLGIHISIDDFGTGHSSLARLRNLPINELKIDKSFIKELPDNRKDIAIVRATIELAHNLGIEVLAEGVESKLAMRWLANMGCERAQGFLISRPMPAETFSQWVAHYGNDDRTAYVNVLEAITP